MITLIIITMFMAITLVNIASAKLGTRLESCYTFDNADTFGTEAGDVMDNNNLTIVNTATGKKGKFGEAYKFDGNGDIVWDTGFSLGTTKNLSFSAWVNVSFTSNNYPNFIGGVSSAVANDYDSGFTVNAGAAPDSATWQYVEAEGVGMAGGVDLMTSTKTYNTWYYLTVVIGAGTNEVKLYINGTPENNRSRTIDSNLPMTIFRIGARQYDGSEQGYFDGQMDEIAIWNRTLTEDEVSSLWNSGTGMNCSALKATLTDSVFPVINGTLNISSIKKNNVLNVSFNATDETNLSVGQIIINDTGYNRYFNFSLSEATGTFSQNFTITLSRGGVINITGLVNDSSNNQKHNSTIITITDTLGTILVGINNTSPKINENINVSGNCTDIDSDFSLGTLSYNVSGNPQLNFSFIPLSGYLLFNFSREVTINMTRGNSINFTSFCNDTAGTQYQSSSLVTVSNTNPLVNNVSISEVPLAQNTQAKCHFNFSDVADLDTQQAFELFWYSNGSNILTATNNTLLNAPNVTTFSNISCLVRVYDGFDYSTSISSGNYSVGDTSPPQLTNWTLQYSSLTDTSGNTNQFNVTAIDSSYITTISFDINGTINVSRSFSFTQGVSISASYTIFSSQESLLAGTYNLTRVTLSDVNTNSVNYYINKSFIVTIAPSPSTSSGGGGGGGGGASCPINQTLNINGTCVKINQTIAPQPNCNFNSICEAKYGEDPLNCPSDCKVNLNYLTCDDPTQRCISDIFDSKNATFRFSVAVVLLAVLVLGAGQIKKTKS